MCVHGQFSNIQSQIALNEKLLLLSCSEYNQHVAIAFLVIHLYVYVCATAFSPQSNALQLC